jgi:hypothetical protein
MVDMVLLLLVGARPAGGPIRPPPARPSGRATIRVAGRPAGRAALSLVRVGFAERGRVAQRRHAPFADSGRALDEPAAAVFGGRGVGEPRDTEDAPGRISPARPP